MKGLIIKHNGKTYKVGAENTEDERGIICCEFIIRNNLCHCTIGALKMPENKHVNWFNDGLTLGDVFELECVELDMVSPVLGESCRQVKSDLDLNKSMLHEFLKLEQVLKTEGML